MSALNLTHELLAERQQRKQLQQRLEQLSARLDAALPDTDPAA
jgi:cell division protein ZapA (FtsZ GTPase activity inhibitor)